MEQSMICQVRYDFNLANPNERDYVEDLKKSIIEMYNCIIFACSSPKLDQRLIDHYPTIATFVIKTCDASVNPTIVSTPSMIGIPKRLFIFIV